MNGEKGIVGERGKGRLGSFLVPLLAAVSDISPLPFCHLTQHSLWSHFTFYIFYIYISRLTFWSELPSSLCFFFFFFLFSIFAIFIWLSISISLSCFYIIFFIVVIRCSFDIIHWTRRAEIVSAISLWNKFHIAHISSIYRYACESGQSTRSVDNDIHKVWSKQSWNVNNFTG